jgi:hypothetical protein
MTGRNTSSLNEGRRRWTAGRLMDKKRGRRREEEVVNSGKGEIMRKGRRVGPV